MSDVNNKREIDLLDLFSKIGNGIRNFIYLIGDIILWNIKTAVKYYWMIIVFGVIGIVMGIVTYVNFSPAYQSMMVLRTNSVNSSDMVPYINQLADVDYEKEKEALSEVLKLDTADVKDIVSIKAYYYVDLNKDNKLDYIDFDEKFNARDTTNTLSETQIAVMATVRIPSQLNLMSDAIVNYINNNNYFKSKNDARIRNRSKYVEVLTRESQLIDSLELERYFNTEVHASLQMGSSVIFGKNEEQLFYRDKLNVNSMLNNHQEEITVNPGIVTIMTPFPVQSTPTQSNIVAMILRVLQLLILGYLVSVILELIVFVKTKL